VARGPCATYFGDGDDATWHITSVMPACTWRSPRRIATPRRDHGADADIPDNVSGNLPAQPRRIDARDVTSRERDYMYKMSCGRPSRQAESRHPPTPRAADGKRPRAHQADEQPAAVHARRAPSSTSATRSGWGQLLPGRPQWRPHSDAVESRSQCRVLARADPQQLYLPRSWTRSTAKSRKR